MNTARRLTARAAGLCSIGLALCLLVVLVAGGPLAAPLGAAHTVVAGLLLVPAAGLIFAASIDVGHAVTAPRGHRTPEDR